MPYYLNEEDDWNIDYDELVETYENAVKEGTDVKAIVVINPGNPTGSIMNRSSLEKIVKFAEKNNLYLMADEVY